MPKKVVNCPSCGEETFAGKYCVECGAKLETEKTARPSDTTLDEIADELWNRLSPRIVEAMKPKPEPPAEPDGETKPKGGDHAKTGLFKR